ncbi:uncharacterized protein LOC132188079 [Corylus avellana]|uniref:uncharacterized protein LOC132188078 n=1 Tax=Corylus avellana TaxID=13451 RepID=UPI00286BE2DA|nr:uncharacterized protein LOC132188078 [Corylus avellana]XP_059458472.1 uncharacterized protein LOC132188079 [Corylus avellana]
MLTVVRGLHLQIIHHHVRNHPFHVTFTTRTKVSAVSLKLVVDKKKQRVLFAEAEKEFVDFLFTIFSLPVGTVTMLLKEEGTVGCLPSLYKSVENLSVACFQPDQNKDFLLKPRVVIPGLKAPLLLPNDEFISREVGYVKGMVSYMVMDDLEVKPMSTDSSFTLLREFNVKAAGDIEKKVVNLGMDEGLNLFKASLQSKTVLTDVLLRTNPDR